VTDFTAMTAGKPTAPLFWVLTLATIALLLLALPAGASAASITLKCGGKGKHNKDSAGTVLCAAKPGQPRVIEGVLRDDSNKPAAGKVSITVSNWVPQGGYYTVEAVETVTVNANGAGKFSYAAKTDTKISLHFEAAGAAAEAEVSRELQVSVQKLGGGKVKLTAKGAGKVPLKLYLLDESGYELPGTKGMKANRSGSATFNVGSYHGPFSYYVDAGEYGDLFWESRGPVLHI
jgi:hypothetical protein